MSSRSQHNMKPLRRRAYAPNPSAVHQLSHYDYVAVHHDALIYLHWRITISNWILRQSVYTCQRTLAEGLFIIIFIDCGRLVRGSSSCHPAIDLIEPSDFPLQISCFPSQ